MSDVSKNAAENENRCVYHILLSIRRVETRLVAKSRHKIAVQVCGAQKVHLERAVNCVPQVVRFIFSLQASSLSRRKVSSAGNLDHFEAVLSNKLSCTAG
jgi:hypothetical protein